MSSRSLSYSLALLGAFLAPSCGPSEERPASAAHAPLATRDVPEEPSVAGSGPKPAAPEAPETAAAPGAPTELELNLAVARAAWEQDPADEDAIIWYGRRLAYLGRYHDAEEVYSDGLKRHPESYRLRRHRGHRLISMRRFEEAARDLAQAVRLIADVPDAVEADGLPNEQGLPRSTTHTNIYYHLGLAWYLQSQFELAERYYAEGMAFAGVNDDMLCAMSYWLYLTRRRLGQNPEAAAVLEPIRAEMDVIENHAYHELLRYFRDELAAEQVLAAAEPGTVDYSTRAYGVGARHLIEGRHERALELFEQAATGSSSAFGYIAAEAELRRLR